MRINVNTLQLLFLLEKLDVVYISRIGDEFNGDGTVYVSLRE